MVLSGEQKNQLQPRSHQAHFAFKNVVTVPDKIIVPWYTAGSLGVNRRAYEKQKPVPALESQPVTGNRQGSCGARAPPPAQGILPGEFAARHGRPPPLQPPQGELLEDPVRNGRPVRLRHPAEVRRAAQAHPDVAQAIKREVVVKSAREGGWKVKRIREYIQERGRRHLQSTPYHPDRLGLGSGLDHPAPAVSVRPGIRQKRFW